MTRWLGLVLVSLILAMPALAEQDNLDTPLQADEGRVDLSAQGWLTSSPSFHVGLYPRLLHGHES
jgi:hypothetical protein